MQGQPVGSHSADIVTHQQLTVRRDIPCVTAAVDENTQLLIPVAALEAQFPVLSMEEGDITETQSILAFTQLTQTAVVRQQLLVFTAPGIGTASAFSCS